MSSQSLVQSGAVALLTQALSGAAQHLDMPGNPTAASADAGLEAHRAGGCDGVVAPGGSVGVWISP